MNPEAAQVIGDLILRACQSLDSAPVQMLEEEDVTTFFKIRAAYDELLKATHKHCRNYAPTYTFVADCLAAAAPQDVEQTVASINDYLAKSDFGNVIQSAKAISEQSLEVCTQVNSFIALLKAKYSADVYFTWSFLVNVLIMTAGVGIVVVFGFLFFVFLFFSYSLLLILLGAFCQVLKVRSFPGQLSSLSALPGRLIT